MKRHTPAVPQPVVGQPTAVGGLDKTIIRRYIKRNVEKIAYCYEKQLLAHPGIEGTVTIQFFISPDGSVKTSNGAGFDNEVSNCVAGVVSAIQFPRPDGGGGVQVNYPFTFHASGT
jgi:outer membrane biosynthesis protein TonB